MAKATGSFHAYDDETAQSVVFEKGDEVPDHIARNVGDHLLDEPVAGDDSADGGSSEGSAFDGEAFDAAVAAKVDEQLEQRVTDAKSEARAAEEAAYGAEGYGEFDPSADGVKAPDVSAYLTGLDRDTAAGSREFARVTEAEKSGANRSSALVD